MTNQVVEENIFTHEKREGKGCKQGVHDFNQEKTRVEVSGNMTRVIMVCMVCAKEVVKEADLNINDLIVSEPQQIQAPESTTQSQPSTTDNSDNSGISSDDIWNKLRGL